MRLKLPFEASDMVDSETLDGELAVAPHCVSMSYKKIILIGLFTLAVVFLNNWFGVGRYQVQGAGSVWWLVDTLTGDRHLARPS